MIYYILSLCALIIMVFAVRALFKKSISQRIVYALWLVVLVRMCLPFPLLNIEFILPERTDTVQSESPVSGLPSFDLPDTEISEETKSPEKSDGSIPFDTVKQTVKIDMKTLAISFWVLGSAVIFIAFIISSIRFSYRLKRTRRFFARERGISVYVSDAIKTPCLYGLLPSIYITPDIAEKDLSSLVVLHEMTHLRHGDNIWNVLRMIAVSVFWWNPLVWAAALVSKKDAELACDESVAKGLGDSDRIAYARLIVDSIPEKRAFSVGFATSPVKERILRIMRKSKPKKFFACLAAFAVSVSIMISFTNIGAVYAISDIIEKSYYGYVEKAHYMRLSDNEKHIYDLLASNLFNPLCVHLELSPQQAKVYDAAYEALRLDNPELEVMTYKHLNEDNYGFVTWKLCDAEEEYYNYSTSDTIERLYNESYEIVSRMPSELSTKEKYEWLADALCTHTRCIDGVDCDYQAASPHVGGALLYKECFKKAYAPAYQLLCRDADLYCETVVQNANTGETINIIRLDDGTYYYMDIGNADQMLDYESYYFIDANIK